MNAASRALERLAIWPDLTSGPAGCGTDRAMSAAGQEIVHFHTDHDADVHLTRHLADKLYAPLSRSSALRLRPGSGWVTVHLDCDDDLHLLSSLVSLAITAIHRRATPGPNGPAPERCSWHGSIAA